MLRDLRLPRPSALALVATLISACAPEGPAARSGGGALASSSAPAASASASAPRSTTITVVGTNDLHGRIGALPLLAGYVANLRRARAADGGGVLLVDGGDMFQGTLESNLVEGKSVADAYRLMGYQGVTVGNHEFDYGPVGPAPVPERPGDDPRGALKRLASTAPFPFLMANVLDKASGARVDWPNMPSSSLVELAGVKVGLVGVTTRETLRTTIAANVADLAIAPLAETIAREASALRARGAAAVVVLAHAGGKCPHFGGEIAADGCELDAEIFEVTRKLPAGAVDVIVAGHTHAGVAHEVGGVAIVEAYAYGRAFDRVDLTIGGTPPRVLARRIEPPRDLCPGQDKPDFAGCDPGSYEGARVERDAEVARTVEVAIDAAAAKRAEELGTKVEAAVLRDYDDESALGNLFADLLREAVPRADVGLMNGGGLRADLPAGPLRYGALYEAFPFDNRLATVKLTARELREVLRTHLRGSGGILSVSGLRVVASCEGRELDVRLERGGKSLRDDESLLVVGSDFLFTGGDDFWGKGPVPEVTTLDELMRDALERGLRKRDRVAPAQVFDPKRPRLGLPARRPVTCGR